MRKYFCPDYRFDTYRQVTPEFLKGAGICALILDIDNTLAPYEQPEPDGELLAWFGALRQNGVRCAFVSNNHPERVGLFNRTLGLPMYPKGRKPFRKYLVRAMADMQSGRSDTAIMGDQVFTDVWAGRAAGIRTILVPPIRDKRDFFTRLKRRLERPVLRYYDKRKNKEHPADD